MRRSVADAAADSSTRSSSLSRQCERCCRSTATSRLWSRSARKVITVDYLFGQLRQTNPMLSRGLTAQSAPYRQLCGIGRSQSTLARCSRAGGNGDERRLAGPERAGPVHDGITVAVIAVTTRHPDVRTHHEKSTSSQCRKKCSSSNPSRSRNSALQTIMQHPLTQLVSPSRGS